MFPYSEPEVNYPTTLHVKTSKFHEPFAYAESPEIQRFIELAANTSTEIVTGYQDLVRRMRGGESELIGKGNPYAEDLIVQLKILKRSAGLSTSRKPHTHTSINPSIHTTNGNIMSETSNETRAQRAENALMHYVEAKAEVFENSSSEIAELIADLLHHTVRIDQGEEAVESTILLAKSHFYSEHDKPEEE